MTGAAAGLTMSVVIPAFNEEQYLPRTLRAVTDSASGLPEGCTAVLIVVDDGSTDGTAAVARAHGASVLSGDRAGIGAARNVGARAVESGILVFVDADTLIPVDALPAVVRLHRSGYRAVAIPASYETDRPALVPLFRLWAWYAPRFHITQGVFQAFDSRLFESLGGYDEGIRMAEDTDLFDRAIKDLRRDEWIIVRDLRVRPSMRRYDQTGAVRLWVLTNPLTTRLLRRRRWLWRAWYEDPPR